MLMITKQGIESLIDRLNAHTDLEQCQAELKRMLEIESDLLWWAQSGKCCRWQAGAYFVNKIRLLKDVQNALSEGNTTEASYLLRQYASELNEDGERILKF